MTNAVPSAGPKMKISTLGGRRKNGAQKAQVGFADGTKAPLWELGQKPLNHWIGLHRDQKTNVQSDAIIRQYYS